MNADGQQTPGLPRYDSTADTLAHIHAVRDRIEDFATALLARGRVHDASKLTAAEKPELDQALAELGAIPYGSPEYEALVAKWAPLIARHQAANRHHPEYFAAAGIGGMTLIDLVEMLCDWIAAAGRVPGQGVDLDYNIRTYDISPQLAAILRNTLASWPPS